MKHFLLLALKIVTVKSRQNGEQIENLLQLEQLKRIGYAEITNASKPTSAPHAVESDSTGMAQRSNLTTQAHGRKPKVANLPKVVIKQPTHCIVTCDSQTQRNLAAKLSKSLAGEPIIIAVACCQLNFVTILIEFLIKNGINLCADPFFSECYFKSGAEVFNNKLLVPKF